MIQDIVHTASSSRRIFGYRMAVQDLSRTARSTYARKVKRDPVPPGGM